jgi:hypothetical protein
VLDHVPLALGDAPAGGDGYDVAEAQGVVGVVDEVGFGVVEELEVGWLVSLGPGSRGCRRGGMEEGLFR